MCLKAELASLHALLNQVRSKLVFRSDPWEAKYH
jgi:hypothetical protein